MVPDQEVFEGLLRVNSLLDGLDFAGHLLVVLVDGRVERVCGPH